MRVALSTTIGAGSVTGGLALRLAAALEGRGDAPILFRRDAPSSPTSLVASTEPWPTLVYTARAYDAVFHLIEPEEGASEALHLLMERAVGVAVFTKPGLPLVAQLDKAVGAAVCTQADLAEARRRCAGPTILSPPPSPDSDEEAVEAYLDTLLTAATEGVEIASLILTTRQLSRHCAAMDLRPDDPSLDRIAAVLDQLFPQSRQRESK